MQFWFVRHGESEHNAQGMFCGSLDSPLTTKGHQQARQAAQFFLDKQCQWIVTSPLVRAYETAEPIARQQKLHLIIDSRLKEHSKGDKENTEYMKMRSFQWRDIPGAEPMESLYERTLSSLQDLSELNGVGIIVSHAGVARAVEAIRTQTSPAELYDLGKVGNAEPYLVTIPDLLLRSNQTTHGTS